MNLVNWSSIELKVQRNRFAVCSFRATIRPKSSLIPCSLDPQLASECGYFKYRINHGEHQTINNYITDIFKPFFVEIRILPIKPTFGPFERSTLQHYQDSSIENRYKGHSYLGVSCLQSLSLKSNHIYKEDNGIPKSN